MSENQVNAGPDKSGEAAHPDQAQTPPAQPAQNAPEALNAGTPDTASPASAAIPAVSGDGTPVASPPLAPATPAAAQAAPAPSAPAAPAAKSEEKALAPAGYIPGGLNRDILKPVQNPSQTDQNFPFSSGQKMHEVAQTQNFFTFPLDTYYNVFDAIYYFAEEKNRNRYTYEQQQLIISRIVRAAQDFGIPIEGIREKLKN